MGDGAKRTKIAVNAFMCAGAGAFEPFCNKVINLHNATSVCYAFLAILLKITYNANETALKHLCLEGGDGDEQNEYSGWNFKF